MPSVSSPPPGRLPSSKDKVFLQLVNVYLLAQGPLSGRPLHQVSTLQVAAWNMEAKILNILPCRTWSTSSTPRAQDACTLAGSPGLLPAPRPAEPKTEEPGFSTWAHSGPLLCTPSHPSFPQPLERLEEEVLRKDPEVERKTQGFPGRMAINRHLIAIELSLTLSKVCSSNFCSLCSGNQGNEGAEWQPGLRGSEHLRPPEEESPISTLHFRATACC